MLDAGCRRQRPNPGSGNNPPLGQSRVSAARKPFLQAPGGLSLKKKTGVSRSKGRKLGDGTFSVDCATPAAGGEWWLCGKCSAARVGLRVLRIPALTGKATHISSTSTYGDTTRSFKELKGREAENKMQQEVS